MSDIKNKKRKKPQEERRFIDKKERLREYVFT